jgi:hypothetical protein
MRRLNSGCCTRDQSIAAADQSPSRSPGAQSIAFLVTGGDSVRLQLRQSAPGRAMSSQPVGHQGDG